MAHNLVGTKQTKNQLLMLKMRVGAGEANILHLASCSRVQQQLLEDGYVVQAELIRSKNSVVVRAFSNVHQRSVIIKYHAEEQPSEKMIQKFVKEFDISREFCNEDCSKYVLQYLATLKYGHVIALVMEDFNAVSLGKIIAKEGVSIDTFLPIAISLARGLSRIHQKGVIHGSITPSNILVNPETLQVKISDFGCSSQLKKEFQPLVYFQTFSISLAYVSPEQTGRANRDVDQRSDFYSLGVVFYEMLCGTVPFHYNSEQYNSMLDVIYSHLAVKPTPLFTRNTQIPEVLSDIVMRLLEKAADSRYQSAFGLEYDLNTCYDQWIKTHRIEKFGIGSRDVNSTFHIHQQIYGRENEIRQLLDAFNSVANGIEANKLLLVRGYSGIGKTTLINEVHKPLTRQRGYFISGKFDQFKRNIPFFAFIQAFQQLILQLLTEPQDKIEYWKKQLLKALQTKGQIIIDVIPQVEMIIGPQPPVPVLKPAENQNRFNAVFQSFIRVFANQEHPLILVLDDLQWADTGTLNLIELLMSDSDNNYLLIIGAYRSNEVNEVHPLVKLLRTLETKRSIGEIALGPLQIDNVNDLISDTLSRSRMETLPLARLVYNKTQGNPFFLLVFLTNLAQSKLLYFNYASGKWEWDINQIEAMDITSNVVEMMTERIQKLPDDTQKLLSLAAGIGNQFTLQLLALVYGKDTQSTYSVLWSAIKDELLIHISSEYKWLPDDDCVVQVDANARFKFLHDRVQQAAYELIEGKKRIELHLKIGRLMRSSLPPSEQEERIFDIIGHFKIAKELLTNGEENLDIINMILTASRRAKDSSAYDNACNMLIFGSELLPDDAWFSCYDTTFQLYKLLSECEYLRRNFERAEELYALLISKSKTDLQKISIYCIQANQKEAQQKYVDTIHIVLNCLKILGIEFPEDEQERLKYTEQELAQIRVNLAGRNIEDLVNSPEITDPKYAAAISLLMSMWTPCYALGFQSLIRCISPKMANLSLVHGNSEVTSAAYVFYSFVAGSLTGDYEEAWQFGKLGVELSNKYDNLLARSKCYFIFGCGTNIWARSLASCFPYLEKCFETSLDAGDLAIADHCAHYLISDFFYSGQELSKAFAVHERYRAYLTRTNAWMYNFGMSATSAMRALMGIDMYNEDEEIKAFSGEPVIIAAYTFGKLQKKFFMRDKSNWLETANEAMRQCVTLLIGTYKAVETNFFAAMIYLDQMATFNEEEQQHYMRQVLEIEQMFVSWSSGCEANFLHKLLMLKAEIARYKGDIMLATSHYEKAIESSARHGYLQYEGLANELCAEMLYSIHKDRYARTHIQDALYVFKKYGAKAKVEYLKQKYISVSNVASESNEDLDEALPSQVDLLTLMKSLKTISSSVKLDEFIDSFMKMIIQNAGAERGVCLLSETDGSILVLAEGDIQKVEIDALRAVPFETWSGCPKTMINFVTRTNQIILLQDCSKDLSSFHSDPYLQSHTEVKSILVLPILKKNEFKGVLYLESPMVNSFNEKQAEILSIMTAQMMILLENEKFSALLESEKRYRSLVSELETVKKRLEEFIDVLCHELRNPLAGLYSSKDAMADLLKNLKHYLEESSYTIEAHEESKKNEIREKLREFKDLVLAFSITSEHLKDIVDTVLTVSMLENQNVKLQSLPFNPSHILQSVGIMFRAKLTEKHLAMNMILPKDECTVVGDPYRLKEVIINLISNAVKFTESGSITLSYDYLERTEFQTTMKFIIQDTGIGLTKSERARLFQPFTQANSQTYAKYGGSGLGLQISKQIVELMGGTISLESEKGKGSTFTLVITLPTHSEQQHYEEKNNKQNSPTLAGAKEEEFLTTKKQSLNVLIAEDNIINQKLLRRLIERSGYKCHAVSDGLECLNYYKEFSQSTNNRVDVILLDIEMPVMSGTESAREIRKFEEEVGVERPVPIIAVSANARNDFKSTITANGMQDFVTKPYLAKDILRVIRQWTQ